MSGWTPWRGVRREAQAAPAAQATVDPDLPPEPPFGIYTCASPKCGYFYVHDYQGWFYVYDYDSVVIPKNQPLKWGRSRYHPWETIVENNGDCFTKPLIAIRGNDEATGTPRSRAVVDQQSGAVLPISEESAIAMGLLGYESGE